MAKLIPWLFLIPPILVTLMAILTLAHARSPRGRALALFRQGGDHLHHQRLDEAEAAFRACIQLQPAFSPAIGSLASLLVNRQRLDEALPLLDQARALDKTDARLDLMLGRCHQGLGNPDKAAAVWAAIPEASDVFVDAMTLLADLYEAQGDLPEAIRHLQRGIDKATVFEARPLKKELKRLQDASA